MKTSTSTMMTTTKRKKKKNRKKTGISLTNFIRAIFGVATCLIASSAKAQKGGGSSDRPAVTRTIEGRVLNNTGAGVPGAIVLIKDSKTLQVRSYIAQADGIYHFFGLSTEVNYTLRAEKQDLTSKQRMVSVFDSHQDVHLDLKLTKKIQPTSK